MSEPRHEMVPHTRPEILRARRSRARGEVSLYLVTTLFLGSSMMYLTKVAFAEWMVLAQLLLGALTLWAGGATLKSLVLFLWDGREHRRALQAAAQADAGGTELARQEIEGALERREAARTRGLALWRSLQKRALGGVLLVGLILVSWKGSIAFAVAYPAYAIWGAFVFTGSFGMGLALLVLGARFLKDSNELRVELGEQRLIEQEMKLVQRATGDQAGALTVATEDDAGLRGALTQDTARGGITEM